MSKVAVLQVADTGPLESLVVMLNSVGYHCCLPSEDLKRELRHIGCDTVMDVDHLVSRMGYEKPMDLAVAYPTQMKSCDLFVDVKAHRSYNKIVGHWPNLKDKILWYRINGGKPEHVINATGDHGDEVNPPCPIITPNQWYRHIEFNKFGKAYTMWPPFRRVNRYGPRLDITGQPICLIHNISGWGYGPLIPEVVKLGVQCYGSGSNLGVLPHEKVREALQYSTAMVHLKSNDAPGYAIYEALASGCPVICSRRLIWRCDMQDLLIPNETCLVFDRETHDPLTTEDVASCTQEIKQHLSDLKDKEYNERIGQAGRNRLLEIMWSSDKSCDVYSLSTFMQKAIKQ